MVYSNRIEIVAQFLVGAEQVQVSSYDWHEHGCYLEDDGNNAIDKIRSHSLVNRSFGSLGMRK